MDTESILQLRNELVGEGAARHSKYQFLMEAMGGDYETRRLQAAWTSFQSFVGKSDVPMDRETFEFRLNLIPSIIRSSRSFISTVPTVRCPATDPTDKDARKLAEKLERVYSGFWQYNLIGKRMNQMGYWNPAFGNTIGVIWPDMKNKRPTLQMRSPYGFYPVIRDIDGYDLSACMFDTRYTARQVKAMYPSLPIDLGQQFVRVTQYYDEKEIVTIVADRYRVNEVKNSWGFVAAVIIPNESFGEGPWGESDIEWVIPLQAERNYRSSMQNAILAMMQMQPIAIEDGDNLPEDMSFGAMDAIPVNPGGKVYRVQPPQVNYAFFQAQDELTKLIDRVGQVPPVMQGQYASSGQTTGRTVSALLGPSQMAFNIKGNEIYPALAVLNKMAMRMWNAMWGKESATVFSIDAKTNSMKVEKFTPSEFEDWYECIVTVDTSSYFDAAQKFMQNLQAVQNRLMSRSTASSMTPGVDDPEREQQLIQEEFVADIQMQQQAAQQDQMNQQPDVGAQQSTARGLSRGRMGKTPAPEPIAGTTPPVPGELQTNPGQASTLLQDMILFFSEVPKLKGKVWLAGGIVSDPQYSPQSPTYTGVEVFLEDPNDKASVNTTMKNKYPEVWGHIVYHDGEPSADEPSILVFDPNGEELPQGAEPTEGENPQGASAGPPPGEMPPELAAMMGGANGAPANPSTG